MTQTQFTLPQTSMCTVLWLRNGTMHEELIATPSTNERLKDIMFANFKCGWSEIRAVKGVNPHEMFCGNVN